ncbi:MAG TPA: hypothetical protein VNJ07_07920, partial [Chitinophagales bacterium]|nr:hypothetical protein [Chitinophagales bacterium]
MKKPPFRGMYAALICLLFSVDLSAQSTYTQIYQLLQAKCGTSGCHDGSNGLFNVMQPEADVYSALVNQPPSNTVASAKGDRLVMPGYPQRSFLLRKIAYGISDPLVIEAGEGNYQPENLTKMPDHEIELVRQWILYGAPQTGKVIDTALINTYYRVGGIDDTYPDHAPPSPGTGFQIYFGKIFLAPGTETEIFIKHAPLLAEDIEIPRVHFMMPQACHHWVVYKFFPNQHTGYKEGIRPLDAGSHASTMDGICAGPGFLSYDLPEGTAYLWEAGTVLDLNLHIRNWSQDSILAADLYTNFYTQPVGTATDYMLVRNFPNFLIWCLQDGNEYSFSAEAVDPDETGTWKIWKLYTHTHRYGTDFDVYLRNSDGTKGAQVYEGFYSYEQGFNVGYYRWGVDVTVRTFPDDELLEVDPKNGFIYEATYLNTDGPFLVTFGTKSTDE